MSRLMVLGVGAALLTIQIAVAQTANFTADHLSGCAPLTINFQDQSTGSLTSWLWDLGKGAGSSATAQHPSAVYTEPGLYTVTLTINGSITTTKVGFIEVYEKPSVNWSAFPQGSCSPVQASFTNLSSLNVGSVGTYKWFFGDGGTSTEEHPVHTYTNAGSYSVTLAVTNSKGCEEVKVIESNVVVQGVNARFETDEVAYCQTPALVGFQNFTTGDGTITYQWDFGDGGTSMQEQPDHTYTQAGSFQVVLTASNADGCSGVFKKNIVIGQGAGISFVPSLSRVCIGQSISFTENSAKNVTSRQWIFGEEGSSASANPTFAFTKSGSFTVTLKALLEGDACLSEISQIIEVVANTNTQFTTQSLCGNAISFKSNATPAQSPVWFFGDNITSGESNPTHAYAAPGIYTIRLSGTNELGCTSFTEREIVVLGDPVATVFPDRTQDCLEPNLSGCAPFNVTLEDHSVSATSYSRKWTFDDGTSSAASLVSKLYPSKGTYGALLTVTDSRGCKDTASVKIRVADVKPLAKLEFDKSTVCVGDVVHFKDISTNGNFSCWEIGELPAGSEKEFDYRFAKPGIYSVALVSKNDGCTDATTSPLSITVKDPFVDFSISKTCEDPYEVALTNLSENFTSIEWDLEGGVHSNAENLKQRYTKGLHTISLTGKNTDTGCEVKVEKTVVIQEVKADFAAQEVFVCKNQEILLRDKSEAAVSWAWTFSDGATTTEQNPTRTLGYPGTFGATLQVTDSDGCTDLLSISDAFHVLDIQGDFYTTSSSTCDEMTVTCTDASVGSPSIVEWSWDFGDGGTSQLKNPIHVFRQQGTYSIKLSLSNGLGKCSIVKENVVLFSNPKPNAALLRTNYCVGEAISPINLSENASAFEWDLGNGKSTSSASPTFSYQEPGTYSLSLKASDTYGCSLSWARPNALTIHKPVAAFDAYQTSAECPPLITAFVNRSSEEVVAWSWDFGDGQFSSLSTPSNTYRKPGHYDVQLIVRDGFGCLDTARLKGVVSIGGPIGSFEYPQQACSREIVPFEANSENTVIYRWDFGNGIVVDGGPSVNTSYAIPGAYEPVLVLIDQMGCEVPLDDGPILHVYGHPQIDFSVEPEHPFAGESIQLVADSGESEQLTWLWPGGESNSDSLVVALANTGDNVITLGATNQYGCDSMVVKTVRVQRDISDLPNVFTPGVIDNKNDTFRIPEAAEGSWEMTIFNRWGRQVFHSFEYDNSWNGHDVAGGVYYYLIRNNLRPERELKGFVHVMK